MSDFLPCDTLQFHSFLTLNKTHKRQGKNPLSAL